MNCVLSTTRRDRGVDLGLDALVLGAQIDDRDGARQRSAVYLPKLRGKRPTEALDPRRRAGRLAGGRRPSGASREPSSPTLLHPQANVRESKRRRWHPRLGLRPRASRCPDRSRLQHLRPRLRRERRVVGDRVTVKCGVQLWDGLRVAADVFIGPNATFTNDPFPRSRHHRVPLQTSIGAGASIGANATILPGSRSVAGRWSAPAPSSPIPSRHGPW